MLVIFSYIVHRRVHDFITTVSLSRILQHWYRNKIAVNVLSKCSSFAFSYLGKLKNKCRLKCY